MGRFFDNYLERIKKYGNSALAEAIQYTAEYIVSKHISRFSYTEHIAGLLAGDVQSGKTSHMFGLMCAAADAGFGVFILLTTDNILLQQQTFNRAEQDLTDFCICGESDYIKFAQNNMKRPAVVILKKNSRILRQWKDNLSSTHFVAGNPLFIVDDEADAASLNTLVNKNKRSTINTCLDDIKRTASSSIYLEVTGTPQAILLQTERSGWKPLFIYYFKPGSAYMGGNFFFSDENHPHVILTDNMEAEEIMDDDEFPENSLKTALIVHLITAAHIMLMGGAVCNFLIHPSIRTADHRKFAEKAGSYLNELAEAYDEPETKESIRNIYDGLKNTKKDILDFEDIYTHIESELRNSSINIRVLNSKVSYEENVCYETGNNIIIGGNSLGRGVTFPRLQTIYYCRTSKNPQADTMWQHARMFGYDRDPDLMRVFMPPKLFKLFSDINTTNNSIIAQIETRENGTGIKMFYPEGLRPTRKNVLDRSATGVFSGGVNYFPFYPINRSIATLDEMLSSFGEETYTVSLKFIVRLLQQLGSEEDDWNPRVFEGFVNAFIADNPMAQGKLIVRRNRDIGRGTGTLLSPNDRSLGDSIKDSVVLTLYKVTGSKGWNGQQIWIPNIKLPGDAVYYSGDSQV